VAPKKQALLGPELDEIREAVHDATRGVTDKYDRKFWLECASEERFPVEIWDAMVAQGLLGLGVPEELGGSGGGMTEVVAAMEAMSIAGIPIALYLLTAFARETILRHASDEQKQRFVIPLVEGESRLCFAITEPNAGTNSFRIETVATKTDKGTYKLNGSKIFISAADAADKMMVVARTQRLSEVEDRKAGFSIFVVDTDSPGLDMNVQDIGIVMPDRQFTVFFSDVEVPAENLIGEEGSGFRYLFDALNPERMLVSAWAIGLGDYAVAKAVDYANERAPFGKPIGSYQGLQHPLARAKANLDAARLMMYSAARIFDLGGDAGYLANAAKLLGSEAATNAVDAAVQTHGGYAFSDEYDVATIWPVTRLLRIAPVNNEMVLNYIGEHVLGLPKSY
jgi:acyl-CoA dehydrogenase